VLKRTVGGNWKGKLSPVLYAVAIPLAFRWRWASLAPDRRIEKALVGPDVSVLKV